MIFDKKIKIKKVFGTFNLSSGPTKIFDENILKFLSNLSKIILSSKEAKKFPDLITLGFWCRESNIKALKKEYQSDVLRMGRGVILHITPSNIPMTFAYSLFFGLLSGNQNIVRIPSKNFYQIKLLVNFFEKLLKKKKFISLKKKFVLISYKNSDEISAYLSKFVDGRIIWGGDKTVKKFKSFETLPRCIDLYFADRFSGCIIDLNSLKRLKENEIEKICNDFYTDCYLMDQMGCSSPIVIFWIGSSNHKINKKFWDIFSKIVDRRYDFDLIAANKKLLNLTNLVLNNKISLIANYKKFNILRINIKKLTKDIVDLNPKFGSFYEIHLPNLKKLSTHINKKFQTLVYYGIDRKHIENLILEKNLKGIDRVVPIGRAFDLNTKWDGYDIVLNLSRIISK